MDPVDVPAAAVAAVDHHPDAPRPQPRRPSAAETVQRRPAEQVRIERLGHAVQHHARPPQELGVGPVRDEVDLAPPPRQVRRQREVRAVHAARLHEVAADQQDGCGVGHEWLVANG
jgi:hypothetical protein